MTIASPLISCLCITRNDTALLQRAIHCFLAQTYPNKELVIVYEDDNLQTALFLQTYPAGENIRSFSVPARPKSPLGALRNYSLQMAAGDYICQWDDDDWYHRERLAVQFRLMQQAGKDACILEQWLLFDGHTGKAYLSHKRYWEGSLLCRKDLVLQNQYAGLAQGEDTPTVTALSNAQHIHLVRQQAHLYIYNYHGRNTWDYRHFKDFFHYATLLPAQQSLLVEQVLMQQYDMIQAASLLDEAFTFAPS